MLIYHGTTIENLQNILQHGLQTKHPTIWNCSRKNHLYFWAKPDSYDTEEARRQLCLERALEGGQIAAAATGSAYTELAVLTYNLDESLLDEYADTSCNNMEGSIEIPIEDIDFSKLFMYQTLNALYQPMLRPFYLVYIQDRQNQSPKVNTSPLVAQTIEYLQNTDIESIFDMCMEPLYCTDPTLLRPVTSDTIFTPVYLKGDM